MGKGDSKTRKGKIAKRSYGNKRPHAEAGAATTAKVPLARKTVASRPPAAPARKPAAPSRPAAPSKTAGTARKTTGTTRKA